MCSTEIASTHSIQNKTFTFPGYLIFYNLLHHESLNYTQYFFFFDGASSEFSAIVLISFTVPILLGDSRILGLNENKIRCRLGCMDMEQTVWKS